MIRLPWYSSDNQVHVQISEVYELHFETMDYFHKTGRSWSLASSFFCFTISSLEVANGETLFAKTKLLLVLFSGIVCGSDLKFTACTYDIMMCITFQSVLVGAAGVIPPDDLGWSLPSITVTTDNLHFVLASRKGESPYVKPKGIESFYPYVKVTVAIHDDTCLENGMKWVRYC